MRLAPDESVYRVSRANLRAREKNWEGVVEDLDRAIEQHPDDALLIDNRGAAKGELGDGRTRSSM